MKNDTQFCFKIARMQIDFQAHEAISNFQNRLQKEGKIVSVVTQNIDGLHQKSGTKNVLELHGSLYKTRCTKCKHIEYNDTIPICPALEGKWYTIHQYFSYKLIFFNRIN